MCAFARISIVCFVPTFVKKCLMATQFHL